MITTRQAISPEVHTQGKSGFRYRIYWVVRLYLDGFRAMTVGKTLWVIILVKLFVLFAVLKFFFFSDYLQSNFSSDGQRAEHVLEQITQNG